jgi:hypothetical protein
MEEAPHPIPEALEQGVRANRERHRQDVELLRAVALPFLEPTLPPSADRDAGAD